jgi:4-hydroxy-3-methylbut-2-enyl diphosphate reductase IspH
LSSKLIELGTERRHDEARLSGVGQLLLLAPRGYCAGVERAVQAVEEALTRWGPPIYVRKQIVHNTNRQRAVKEALTEIDLLLVIGSSNSSNSNRLVEVARANGVKARLIEDVTAIDGTWFSGVECVGVTAGASVPEWLVQDVVSWFRERSVEEVRSHEVVSESVNFRLPLQVRAIGGERAEDA